MFLASIFRNDVFPRCAARQLPGQPSVTQRMIQKKKEKKLREREREKEYKEKEIEQREKIIAARVLGVRGT